MIGNTAYIHHKAGDAGPFQTVLVHLRRASARTDGTRWHGRIRSVFQYREHGKSGWRTVWRDEFAPAWASWKAPRHYALIAGQRHDISV
jgi:hypothetical protein